MAKGEKRDREQITEDGGVSLSLVVGGIIGLAVVVFILQNRRDTKVDFLIFDIQQPLWIILALTGALSIVGAGLVGRALGRRRRRED
ncbi:MAG: hypothetical protein U5K30_09000 [Acidimicrobiales bacterium]|nr:hypothetical protein [Acidimicrobiales bacterium]